MQKRGSDGDAVERARAAVYGPDATPHDVAELHRLLAEPGGRDASSAEARDTSIASEPASHSRSSRRLLRVLVGIAAVAAAVVLLAVLVRPGRLAQPLPTAIATAEAEWRASVALVTGSRGAVPADRAFERQPDRLPSAWRDRPAPISFLELDGRSPVTMPDSTVGLVLLVVGCGAPDRAFRWRVRPGSARGTGVCDRLEPIEVRVPPGRTLQVDVRTDAGGPFSLTTYRR